jgi:hypothetical protein
MKRQKLLCVVVGWGLICCVPGVAQEKGNWRAASTTARSITGDVAFSDVKISINFSSYWIAQIHALDPAETKALFGDDIVGGSGNLYRLSIPGTKTFLHKSTLCGDEDAQWIATNVTGHVLRMAILSGSKMPVFTPDALANSTDLCGTFSYVK